MKNVSLGDSEVRPSILGFGCAAVMGRVGRKDSWAALTAAYDAGINFFDTARSYGYGESEALLGEFLQGRRGSVILSTKFGIVPAKPNLMKRLLKPVARTVFSAVPQARSLLRKQMDAQFSAGHFSVRALHESVDASLRALRTDYIDLLSLHEPPAEVLQRSELFEALGQLVSAGKIRHFGIAADAATVRAANAAGIAGLTAVQFPCNVFQLESASDHGAPEQPLFIVANHPFGGAQRVAQVKQILQAVARDSSAPLSLREALSSVDDCTLADVVLPLVLQHSGANMVVASMLRLDHLRANIAALESVRFTAEELRWMGEALAHSRHTSVVDAERA